MTQLLSDALREKIKLRLGFYEDLALAPFFRQRSASPLRARHSSSATSATAIPHEDDSLPKLTRKSEIPPPSAAAQSAAPMKAVPPPSSSTPFPLIKTSSFFEQLERVENDSLPRIREDLGDCIRCRLSKTRKHIVFADGNPKAELVFVGEGPGADEDASGIPFVGRAGKLLTQMIQAMGLQREDVYICNVVKCRPPENRQPQPDEVTTCSPFLVRQLEVVNPKVIVCLGATAAQTLLETSTGISKFRGQWMDFRGKKLMATYHPAYLLRNPPAKSEVWKDLQKVMAELGLQPKPKSV
jgi:uracil-DNA glycosylase